jgi:hypothetical protein
MAMVPFAEGAGEVFSMLTPQQKTLVVAKAYDEAKSLVLGGYRGARAVARRASGAQARQRRRRRKKRQLQRRQRNVSTAARSGLNRSISSAPTMMAATAMTTTMRQSYSRMLRAYKVTHREYIRDINGSVGFSVLGLPINVGKATTFPWLSRIALNFEQYKFNRLKFSLKTQAPTTIPGSVILAIDYDPTDPAPLTKADMLQYEGATRSAPWNDCTVVAAPKNMARLSKYYVSPANPLNSADLRLQDVGNLFIATQGQSDDSVVSELWVEYEVDLITPQSSTQCMQQRLIVQGEYGDFLNDSIVVSEASMAPILVYQNGDLEYTANVTGVFTMVNILTLGAPITLAQAGNTGLTVNGTFYPNDSGPFLSGSGLVLTHFWSVSLVQGDTISFDWDNPAAVTYTYVTQIVEADPSLAPPVN